MDNSLTPEKQHAVIEDALHSYPIVPLPRDITSEVMRRITILPAPRTFRLAWDDFIQASFLSICIAALWFSLDHLPPLLVAQIRKERILLYQSLLIHIRWLLPVLSLGLAAFLCALTIPYWTRELQKSREHWTPGNKP